MARTKEQALASLDSTSPAIDAKAVTPNDSSDLPDGVCRALWIGTAGDGTLKVTTALGTEIAFTGVPVGRFDLQCQRVWSAGTGVSNIVALY